MATTSRKNASVKALQTFLAKNKKFIEQLQVEYQMISTNLRMKNYTQEELKELYSRYVDNDDEEGASKVCHLKCHNGNKFETIVIKRHKMWGWLPSERYEHGKCTGNQLIDEINCWLEYQDTKDSDYLCPILKYYTSKSDKVKAKSETMQNNVVIIAQQAKHVGACQSMCIKAYELNMELGIYDDYEARYNEMRAFSKKNGWRDALRNGGNSGVIWDYAQNKWKCVFIDYAL